ncbi:substrate-binding domain-containing protein [Bartonella sp. HY329]|uniref:substrate-binding domain-containing protein n=1 Tax=unclassified Bartonella TaxID=2645622 RepID=UPI0021C99DD9|nr:MULTISPECIES: substrate-binding domain-containing protein [unclassified Bartonella]UXM94411.1 substrate-binding domain-containing protein [Bartonella sp. HY329]UXN08735.1 substrate-binding domain-containing protein [Bartonella sp. HY328]
MKRLLAALICSVGFCISAQAQTIGMSFSLFDDNFITILRKKIEAYVATKDGLKARTEDAQGDISRQQSQIENFMASNVDGLMVLLVDADSGIAVSRTAQNAGVPLVFLNNAPTNVDQLPKGQSFVGSDEVEAGLLQAEYVCKVLNGKGNVVILQGLLGTTGQRGRTKGVHDGFAKEGCKDIKIVEEQSANWFRTNAMDLMTNWLSAGFQFDAVLANNDEMALGAIQAMKAAGMSMDKVVVVGVDGTPDGLAAIRAGDLDATIFQNTEAQGHAAVDAMIDLVNGKELPQAIYVPFEPITKENLESYANRN